MRADGSNYSIHGALSARVRYLGLSILGLGSTWTHNVLWMLEQQRLITAQEFLLVGFQGTALLGSLASDFWVGSFASLIFMITEARRIALPRVWVYIVLTFAVAWAFALPLFLFMRERQLYASKTTDAARSLPPAELHGVPAY